MQVNATIRTQNRAFTLLEVLLAVGIFAIVLFAINTVFFSALRLERATSRNLDERLPLNQALDILRRDLQGAVPPLTNSTLLPRHFIVTGSSGRFDNRAASSLEFYTTTGVISDDEPWGDIQRVRYELLPSTDPNNSHGLELVRSVWRNILAINAEDEDEQLLAENIASLDFLCYDGSTWRNGWDTESGGDEGLPQAVQVQLQLAGSSPNQTQPTFQEPIELLVPITTQLLEYPITEGAE